MYIPTDGHFRPHAMLLGLKKAFFGYPQRLHYEDPAQRQ